MEITCSCGQKLEVEDHLAGQTVQCPSCQKQFTAPALQRIVVDDDPAQRAMLRRLQSRASMSLWFGIIGLVLYLIMIFISVLMGPEGRSRPGSSEMEVMGLLFIVLIFVAVTLGILAVVFGVLGRKPENTQNRGSGTAGMVLGIIDLCISACCIGMVGFVILMMIAKGPGMF
jgi:hypothetical protein